MLDLNPETRISAQDIMNDSWVKSSYDSLYFNTYNNFVGRKNMNFYKPIKLAMESSIIKKCIIADYSRHNCPIENIEELRNVFKILDKDCSGSLTYKQINAAMKKGLDFSKASSNREKD